MSGFEIIGVVLSVLPLAMKAAGQYGNAANKYQAITRYRKTFQQLDAQLCGTLSTLRLTCERLLTGLALPDDQFTDLIDLQKGWDNPDLQSVLQGRMGKRDYYDFEIVTSSLRTRLEGLRVQLRLEEDWRPPFIIDGKVDKSLQTDFFRSKWRRMKDGFKANAYGRTISEIDSDVKKIRDIIQLSLELEEPRQTRRRAKVTRTWTATRDHSERLYKSLQKVWSAQKCTSHLHCTYLRLNLPELGVNPPDYEERLRCSFVLRDNNPQRQSPLGCYHADLIPNLVQSASLSSNPIPYIKKPKHAGTQIKVCPSNTSIDDLCTSLAHTSNNVTCKGVLHNLEWHYHVHDDLASTDIDPSSMKSLRHVFLGCRDHLSTREKHKFALLLASAVLQFHDTLWLRKKWTLDDILVCNSGGITHLSIAQSFGLPAIMTGDANAAGFNPLPRNDTVFSLGVALLELNYQQTFANPEPIAHLNDLLNKAKKLQQDEPTKFASAVKRCIHQSSSEIDFDLNDGKFLDWFYREVFTPLREDYEIFRLSKIT